MTREMELRARCGILEKQALQAVAQFENLRPSEALRRVVIEAAQYRGLWSPPVSVSRKPHTAQDVPDRI